MKHIQQPVRSRRWSAGLTVIEMSLTLALMMMMATIVVYSTAGIDTWKKGRDASMDLQSVLLAQKSYLADHPTDDPADLSSSDLIAYLPPGTASIPTVTGLEDETLSININVVPPVIDNGSGGVYDPSDSTSDGLWDVGSH